MAVGVRGPVSARRRLQRERGEVEDDWSCPLGCDCCEFGWGQDLFDFEEEEEEEEEDALFAVARTRAAMHFPFESLSWLLPSGAT